MKKMKRIAKLLLAAALLIQCTMVMSCGDSKVGKKKETKKPGEETTVSEITADEIFAGMDAMDYEGREFNILVRDFDMDEFESDDSGDVYDHAVYLRNDEVEQYFNCKINPIEIEGAWEYHEDYMNTIRTSIAAGNGAYDLIDGYAGLICTGFYDHLFLDLNEVPNLRLDQEWWSKLMLDELTVNGRIYAISGDIATNLWEQMQVMFFNKQVCDELGMEPFYDTVNAGEWTIDKYLETIAGLARDNGDGKWDDQDFYGALYADDLAFDNLHNAFGISYTKINSDGDPELDVYNEKTVRCFEIARDLMKNPNVLYITYAKTNVYDPPEKIFSENKSLFYSAVLDEGKKLLTMEADYGVLPVPKFDLNQSDYYTTSRDGRMMAVIPMDVKDEAFSGMITEALCVASNRFVIPTYFDKVLGGKEIRDAESLDMIMLCRKGLRLDFVSENTTAIENAGYIIRECLIGHREITSYYESKKSTYQAAFDKFIDAYYE